MGICKMRAICLFALVLLPAAMAYSSASASVSASGASSSAYSSAPTPTPAGNSTAGSSSATTNSSASPTPAGSSSSYGSATPTPTPTPTPTASPTPAGSSSANTINVVKATLKLPGVTAASFDATTKAGQKLREAFKSTVAMGLKICGTSGTANCTSSDVVITSVSRRRADATVEFYVKTSSSAAANKGAGDLTSYVKGGSFVNNLKSEAQKQGVASAVQNATTPVFTVPPKAGTQSVPTPVVAGAGKTAVAAGVTVALAGLSMLW